MTATKLQVVLAATVVLAGTGLVVQEYHIGALRAELALVTPAGVRFGPKAGNTSGVPTVVQSLSPQNAQELERLRAELANLRTEELRLSPSPSENQELRQQAPRITTNAVADFKIVSDVKQQTASRLKTAKLELELMRQRYLDAHPAVRQKLAEIAELEASLAEMENGRKPGWF